MLRQAVDEIGEELGWAIRTRVLDRLPPPSPTRLSSFPLDPLADDFHDRVNAVSAPTCQQMNQRQCPLSAVLGNQASGE